MYTYEVRLLWQAERLPRGYQGHPSFILSPGLSFPQ